KGTGEHKSPAHQRGRTWHYFSSRLAASDQKLPTQSISSHSLSFLVIPCNGTSLRCKLGNMADIKEIIQGDREKIFAQLSELVSSIRFTLLPNSKTRWTARRRGFPRPCKKQVLR